MAARAAILVVVALAAAACGGPAKHAPARARTGPSAPVAFSWLRPGPPPAGWHLATISSGAATLAYPTTWNRMTSDSGTATAALVDSHGFVQGYLNATPQQGVEQLSGWAHFRLGRNRDEGSRHVRELAAAENLRFRAGPGSCVIDDYTTRVDANRYRELACIVQGTRATTVVIAAAPPREWTRLAPQLERAVSAFLVR